MEVLNILLVDSFLLNTKVIEQDVKVYLDTVDKDYKFFEAISIKETLYILENNKIDIAFVDISSKKFDGIQLLKNIKTLKTHQPSIAAVTTLYDNIYRQEALNLNVNSFIYKPYDYKEIDEIIIKYLENNNLDDIEDDFMDFDDENDDFMDFDDDNEESIEHNKELMDAYNGSHQKVSAKYFLEEYEDIGYDTEDLEDLEEEINSVVANILFEDNLENELSNVIYMLEKYNRFLYSFTEFEELSNVLYGLVELLNVADFSKLTKTVMISKFIVAIIQDLVDWKEHVFILKDAVDVYYINASILNSYVQLKDLMSK
jgi:response regulator RpfG family c-di-GMP phosphodiesterase